MEIPTYLLLVIGILGATDILLYHAISHGIRTHAHSWKELVTHSLRGPTYAFLFIVIPNFSMNGKWFWVLIAILIMDVAISLFDFIYERESRDFFGGLPTGEYILHFIIAMLFGAFFMALVDRSAAWTGNETSIEYSPAPVPWMIRIVMVIMAICVFYSGIVDAIASWKMFRKRKHSIETSSKVE